jgi:predicted metal-dependent hydrolase
MEHQIIINDRSYAVDVSRKKMKRVRLKLFPSMEIKLSVPLDTPDEWITDFLRQKRKWIEEKAGLFQRTKAIEKEEHIKSGVATRILGRQLTVQVILAECKRIEKDDSKLRIYTPVLEQESIDKQFDLWWQKNAKAYYQEVLNRLYPIIGKHDVERPAIFVRKMKTLWGSCGRKHGRINLNFYLYKASVPCIEYVILHELSHFLYPYHNKDFYDFITIHMPDWRERKKLLDFETVLGV